MASSVGGQLLKKTTGLTSLPVAKNPHHFLNVLYAKILRVCSQMPEDAAYRKYTEQIVKERSELVRTIPDIMELEKRIGCGQIEEVLVQAENEIYLAKNMLEWKPWEPLVEEPPANQWKWPM